MNTKAARPRISVATVVAREGRILLVEERGRQGPVLNQPAGHLEAGESLIAAAIRETREESAWEVRVTSLIGIYQWRAPDGVEYVRFGFAAEPLRHHADQALDADILRTLWMTPSQLEAEPETRMRSPMVRRQMHDWLAGRQLPLEALQELAP